MIEIYTGTAYLAPRTGILRVDDYFHRNVCAESLCTPMAADLLMRYEGATTADGRTLNGRFGPFPAQRISSGTKTLLLLALMTAGELERPGYLSVASCGPAVLDAALP